MKIRRAWPVYTAGLFAYVTAITQRTTIGVAGVSATERFHSTAAILSMLAVLQLVVYAGAQIPLGVMLDRFGPRVLMLGGTALMAIGQFVVANAGAVGIAIVGRILVGAGDAAIFISVIRLISSWFPPRRVPVLTQWVSNTGQLGQILSSLPFAAVLHEAGWAPAFLSAGAFAVLGFVVVLLVITDRPANAQEGPRPESWTQSLRGLRASLGRSGTQLGFWSHFTTMSSMTVFTLMWGIPYMVYGLGYPRAEASALLLVPVAAGFVAGPFLGMLTARFPLRRSNLVLTVVLAVLGAWALLLAWPGRPPVGVVVILLIAIGVGGPGSAIGFDFARSFNPLHSLGSANGFVNVGGFTAAFVMMYAIGVLLDFAHSALGQTLYSLDSFRLAFLVQFVVIGLGLLGLLWARGRTRRQMLDEEGIEVGPLWVALNGALGRRKAERG